MHKKTPGGLSSLTYSLKVARKVGFGKFYRSIRSKNTCKTCAYGMGGQKGGMHNEAGTFLEICKKSIQAQITDIQQGIPESFYKENAIKDIAGLSGRELDMTGLALFWTILFGVAVVLFLAVEVVVVIGGASDIADMIRSLLEHRRETEGETR